MNLQRNHDEGTEPDLVEYLVVQVPDVDSLAVVGAALHDLASTATINILDAVVVATDDLGSPREVPIESITGFSSVAGATGSLLSERDIRLAALALHPGTTGVVLVVEDRWAAPLAAAARSVGGRLAAGERIPSQRVERAFAAGVGRED